MPRRVIQHAALRANTASRASAAIVLVTLLLCMSGCAVDGPTSIAIEPGTYDKAFEATVEALRDARFPIERIDAARGVIATGQKRTAGLATPWHGEQQSLGQEWQDLVNDQSRAVRVTFAPATNGEFAGFDLRDFDGPITLDVASTIYRYARPNVRTETEAAGLVSVSIDRKLVETGAYRSLAAPLRRDEPHARAVVANIQREIKRSMRPD